MTQRPPAIAIAFYLIAVPVLIGAIQSTLHLNPDTSWLLLATQKWIAGATLYTDIIEINPPLTFYVMWGPVQISSALGLDLTTGFIFSVSILIGAVLLWADNLLRRVPALAPRHRQCLTGGLLLVLGVLPCAIFGQREHLMVIFSAPYFLALASGFKTLNISRRESLLLGLLALPGLALKPYFLAAPVLASTLQYLNTRSLRDALFNPANMVLGTGVLCYPVAIALLHPAYYTDIIPLARATYNAYADNPVFVFANPVTVAAPLLAGIVAIRLWHRRAINAPVVLAGVAKGFVLAYFIQFTGASYRSYPASAYILLSSIWLMLSATGERHRRVIGAAGLSCIVLLLGIPLARGPYQPPYIDTLKAAFPPALNAPAILSLHTGLPVSFPLTNEIGGQWVSRYPSLWTLPGAVHRLMDARCADTAPSDICDGPSKILGDVRAAIMADAAALPPDIILIDAAERKAFFSDIPFDYYAFMEADPGFKDFLSAYQKVNNINGIDVWIRTFPLP